MWLLDFLNGFLEIFRSRYVRYLEKEVKRLRQETAALNHTLLATKGIQQVASPDMQDLTARGRDLRTVGSTGRPRREGDMRPVVSSPTHAKLRRQLELADQKQVAQMEKEIRDHKDKQEELKAHAQK